jgi:hypothetical protein
MRNTADTTGGKPIAVLLQSISDVSVSRCIFYVRMIMKQETRFCLKIRSPYVVYVCGWYFVRIILIQ